ncbi:unnamed protein product, partial [Allacma fusca]
MLGYWSQEEEEEKSSPALRYPQEKSQHRLPAALRTESGRGRSEFAVILDEDIFVVVLYEGRYTLRYHDLGEAPE